MTFDFTSKIHLMKKDSGFHFASDEVGKKAMVDYIRLVRDYLVRTMATTPTTFLTIQDTYKEMRTVDGAQKTWIPSFDANRVPTVMER